MKQARLGDNQNSPSFRKIKSKLRIFQVISVVLILSNALVYVVTRLEAQVDPGLEYRQKYNLLDGNRRLAKPENLIVNLEEHRRWLKTLPAENQSWADMSIYFESLSTGANITVNPDLKLWPASLAKLPVAMVAMRKIEKGEWTDQTKIQMTDQDIDLITTPNLAQEADKSYDIRFLLERLLLESDNTAYNMLVRNMSDAELNSIGEAVGLEDFFSPEGKISAKDYTRLFRALYQAAYLNEDNSQQILKLLQDSNQPGLLKAGIPADIPFAHKWGTNLLLNVYADSGIVYLENRPYLISVIIQAKNNDAANTEKVNKLMKDISSRSYEFMRR